jgi:transcriptional regulator with XRE-family HTH domain
MGNHDPNIGNSSIPSKETFTERLKKCIGSDSHRSIALKAQISTSVMKRYVDGDTVPGLYAAARLAEVLNVSLDWLVFGEEKSPARDNNGQTSQNSKYDGWLIWPGFLAPSNGVQQIPEFRAITPEIDWLESQGLDTSKIQLARCVGDSMHPTIPKDAVVLIDTSRSDLADGIWLLRGNTPRRIQTDTAGGIWLICDNERYKNEHFTNNEISKISVLGKVVWASGIV